MHSVIYLRGEKRGSDNYSEQFTTQQGNAFMHILNKEMIFFHGPKVEKQIWNSYYKHPLSNTKFL